MKVLVIGSGGREHSIVKKLSKSPLTDEIFAAPGNGGIEEEANCVDIGVEAIEELVAFAKKEAIDWTIVGPEIPLVAGIVDAFKQAGLNVFGPEKNAALIEGSKDFAKSFMERHQIPTARSKTFTETEAAISYIRQQGAPIVVKADGLAAGKGVIVAMEEAEAVEAVETMLVGNRFGSAGSRVVIEDFLDGKEFSLMAFVHEKNVYPMIAARDHKRAFDHDQGPNTGGMGAYAPIPDLDSGMIEASIEQILKPAAAGLAADGRPFTGVLYAGLIETNEGPKVIEFNARFGDPETQVVLPLLENDLLKVIIDVCEGRDPGLKWSDQYCIGTVVAAAGYPGSYEKGNLLPSLSEPEKEEAFVVHAGTKREENGSFRGTGGRVLLAGAVGENRKQAQQHVYQFLNRFEGNDNFFYRKDIGV